MTPSIWPVTRQCFPMCVCVTTIETWLALWEQECVHTNTHLDTIILMARLLSSVEWAASLPAIIIIKGCFSSPRWLLVNVSCLRLRLVLRWVKINENNNKYTHEQRQQCICLCVDSFIFTKIFSLILHTNCFPGCCEADQSRRIQSWSICFDFPEFAGLEVAASVALRGVCCLSNSSCVCREPRGGEKGSVVYRLSPTHPLFVCVSPSLCLTPCFPSEKKLFSVLVKGNTKQGCLLKKQFLVVGCFFSPNSQIQFLTFQESKPSS